MLTISSLLVLPLSLDTPRHPLPQRRAYSPLILSLSIDLPFRDYETQLTLSTLITIYALFCPRDYIAQLTLTTLITIYAVIWSAHKPADPPGKDNLYPSMQLIWSAQKPADPPGKDNHYPDNYLCS